MIAMALLWIFIWMDVPFSSYLNCLSIYGTFGDEITLRVSTELFNIEFVIISTLVRAAEATITPRLRLFGTLCRESWGTLCCS